MNIVVTACVASALSLFLLGGCAAPPKKVPVPALERTTFSGTPLKIWYFYSVQVDCSSGGLPTVLITAEPSHGSVDMQNIEHFTDFPASNQRFECNKHKSPSVSVVYTSSPAFVGQDRFTVKCVFPSGDVTTKSFLVNVEKMPTT